MNPNLDRAQAFIDLRRYREARKELHRALGADPDSCPATAMLAYCESKLGNPGEAKRLAAQAVGLDPSSAFAHRVVCHVALQASDIPRAEIAARESIRLEPQESRGYGLLALSLRAQAKWEASLAAAEDGLSINAIDLDCLIARAHALSILERSQEAIEAARILVQTHPEHPHSHAYAGWVVLRLGRNEAATIHFRQALRLDPEFEWAREGLIDALRSRLWPYRWIVWSKTKGLRFHRGLSASAIVLLIVWLGAAFWITKGDSAALMLWSVPLLLLYGLVVSIAWLARPIFNVNLLLHPLGRIALRREERHEAALFAFVLPVTLFALLVSLATNATMAWQSTVGALALVAALNVVCHTSDAARYMKGICALGYLGGFWVLLSTLLSLTQRKT